MFITSLEDPKILEVRGRFDFYANLVLSTYKRALVTNGIVELRAEPDDRSLFPEASIADYIMKEGYTRNDQDRLLYYPQTRTQRWLDERKVPSSLLGMKSLLGNFTIWPLVYMNDKAADGYITRVSFQSDFLSPILPASLIGQGISIEVNDWIDVTHTVNARHLSIEKNGKESRTGADEKLNLIQGSFPISPCLWMEEESVGINPETIDAVFKELMRFNETQ